VPNEAPSEQKSITFGCPPADTLVIVGSKFKSSFKFSIRERHAMNCALMARVELLLMAVMLITGSTVQCQEQARLMPQLGMGKVTSVAFSQDGRFVLTGSDDHTARLWDVATGLQIRAYVGHTDEVTSVALSPDGRSLLTGSEDKTARLWSVTSGEQFRSFDTSETNFSVHAVAFSPNGRYALAASWDMAWLRDRSTGQPIRGFGAHDEVISAAAFSPDGRYVVTGSNFSPNGTNSVDKTARLWDVTTGHQIRTFEGHTSAITSVAFSANGRFLLTGSRDCTARLWNVKTGKQVHLFESFAPADGNNCEGIDQLSNGITSVAISH
jgi:WD40 repeat protein